MPSWAKEKQINYCNKAHKLSTGKDTSEHQCGGQAQLWEYNKWEPGHLQEAFWDW